MAGTYLDHAATTPLRSAALDAVVETLRADHGNPSGAHGSARRGRRLLDDARDRIADTFGVAPAGVVFTSGGTEADDLAVRGAGHDRFGPDSIVVASAVEHSAVRAPVLADGGELLPVDGDGRIDLEALRTRLRAASDATAAPIRLVSIMAANNETGARNDLAAIAAVLDETAADGSRPLLHTDAIAAAPWVDPAELAASVDLLSVSAHKLGGPMGMGALVLTGDHPLRPRLLGGGQERERRSGTPDVAGAVGFATAVAEAALTRRATTARVETLRTRLLEGLEAIPDLIVLSPAEREHRTPGTVMVGIAGVEREALVFLLDRAGIATSWGSSCASGASEPSTVLAAMGVDPQLAAGSLRLSLGWCSTGGDVDHLLAVLPDAVAQLRREDP